MVIALPLGALLGIARLSDHGWLRWPAGVIVEFFRSIPVLILMLFAFDLVVRRSSASSSPSAAAVVIGLVLYNGVGAGRGVPGRHLSLPRGQTEAALAIGLRKAPDDDDDPAAAGDHRRCCRPSSASWW